MSIRIVKDGFTFYIKNLHNTLLKFIKKVYKLNSKEKGYYISLSYERKKSSAKSKLNGIYNERTQHLIEIGKKNPFKQ